MRVLVARLSGVRHNWRSTRTWSVNGYRRALAQGLEAGMTIGGVVVATVLSIVAHTNWGTNYTPAGHSDPVDVLFGRCTKSIDDIGRKNAWPSKRVPVLFSTNRGLYLRLAPGHPGNQMEVLTLQPRGQNYNISFCDLERWSTNRANVVSLEDTFTIMQQRNMSPESHNYQPRLWKNNVSYSLMH
ncbi:uncharacterized protein LOC110189855 [Drosophila serrata]|uniref:uncharacterized protein LOC110189855 n=1 Tax=Drosophila serrata TaxID=7274 RepID=UPI000A1D3005|nr:uncharacterized protein LOC110189855 [Drosophila serrata]